MTNTSAIEGQDNIGKVVGSDGSVHDSAYEIVAESITSSLTESNNLEIGMAEALQVLSTAIMTLNDQEQSALNSIMASIEALDSGDSNYSSNVSILQTQFTQAQTEYQAAMTTPQSSESSISQSMSTTATNQQDLNSVFSNLMQFVQTVTSIQNSM
tara:strand:- start:51 stop:518 length:468 start_codon:yes stop_codon:yes gene_type:complete